MPRIERIFFAYIKVIEPYAFNLCSKISKIEFQTNSELQIISNHAFTCSAIKKNNNPTTCKANL